MSAMTEPGRPRVLPGSLITLRCKCGKATCRCATGAPHESPALSYSVGGRTKMLTLAAEEVPAVAGAVSRYRTTVNELEAEARAELEALVEQVFPPSTAAAPVMTTTDGCVAAGTFVASRERFELVLGWLAGGEAGGSEHGELEECLQTKGPGALRSVLDPPRTAHQRTRHRAQPRNPTTPAPGSR